MSACHWQLSPEKPSNAGPATAELRHEHEVILRALALLDRAADRLAAELPPDESLLQELVGFFQAFADRCHHGKEEHELFPLLEEKGIGGPLFVFRGEHEEGRVFLRAVGTPGSGASRAAAARRYAGLLRDHIERENAVLFPMADDVLTLDDHDALVRRYATVERETMGRDGGEALDELAARFEAALVVEPGAMPGAGPLAATAKRAVR